MGGSPCRVGLVSATDDCATCRFRTLKPLGTRLKTLRASTLPEASEEARSHVLGHGGPVHPESTGDLRSVESFGGQVLDAVHDLFHRPQVSHPLL